MDLEILEVILACATAGWALAFLLQLVDVITGHQVRRAGRAAGTRDRDRILTWTVAVCSSVLVLVIVGIDFATRLILDRGDLLWGLLLLVGFITGVVITALLAARALRRPETGYQVIRDELKSLAGTRLAKGRLADYRAWLATLDARGKDVHTRVATGRWVRSIPVLVALIALAAVVALMVVERAEPWQVALYLVPVAVSAWLAVWGARISLARNLAIHAVHHKQRAEAIVMLEDLDRKAPRKVAGLSERVSRALAILREQQGQDSSQR
jgi:hypothetical protein